MQLESIVAQLVTEAVKTLYGAETTTDAVQVHKPQTAFAGDVTVVVFPFVKMARKSPEQTAAEIGEYLQQHSALVADFNAVKGFLNLTISDAYWIDMLNEIDADAQFGHRTPADDAPLMMVEYSSPNTNKPLHLGHVRNNLLGYSISKIQQANGWRVVKTNIVNDRGIHICKSMLAWKLFGNGETPQSSGKKGDHLVGDYYVRFDQEYRKQVKQLVREGLTEDDAKKQAPLMLEAQDMLRRWEAGDEESRNLWRSMNEWVYAGFAETY